MGRYFVKSGYIIPKNIQTGTLSLTTDANGDGTTEVTFPSVFKEAPKMSLLVVGNDITGTPRMVSKSETAFVAGIDGSSLTGQAVSVDWIAIDTVQPK